MPKPTTALGQALAALSGRKFEPELGLAAMLDAWRGLHAPSLAEAIEQLGEALAATRPPVAGLSQKEFHAQWLARAKSKDPVALSVLLPSLADTTSPRALARLEALQPWVPDPRFTKVVIELASAPPFVSGSAGKFWTRLYSVLVASADPRAIAALEAVPPLTGRSYAEETLERKRLTNIERMRKAVVELRHEPDEAEAELLAKLGPALARACESLGSGPSEDELLAAIYAEPQVLEHRQVYADLLLTRGDPRGEFIALQLADHPSPLGRKPRARMKALLRDYGRAWVGGLDFALTRGETVFERGFLTQARVRTELRGFERTLGDPAWATVEVLDNPPLALLDESKLRALEALKFDNWLFSDLSRSKRVLERVTALTIRFVATWRGVGIHRGVVTEDMRKGLMHMKPLPELRALVLDARVHKLNADGLGWLWHSDLVGRRLARLELRVDRSNASLVRHALAGLQLRSRYERLEHIRLVHGRASLRLEPGDERDDRWRVIVESRGRAGLPAQVEGELAWLEAQGEAEVVRP